MEQPIDALFTVIAVAVICAFLTVGIGEMFGVKSKHKFPCYFTKIEGFNKVTYRSICEVE